MKSKLTLHIRDSIRNLEISRISRIAIYPEHSGVSKFHQSEKAPALNKSPSKFPRQGGSQIGGRPFDVEAIAKRCTQWRGRGRRQIRLGTRAK